MLTGTALDGVLHTLAGSKTRPRAFSMVRAMPAQFWNDPLAKKKSRWPRARYNDAHSAHVLYIGDDYETAAAETLVAIVPTWIVAFATVQCTLNAVLDLTDMAVWSALGTDAAELSFNFRSLPRGTPATATQLLGEAAVKSGRFDGLLYESLARPGSQCVAVLLDNLGALGSNLAVHDLQQGISETFP